MMEIIEALAALGLGIAVFIILIGLALAIMWALFKYLNDKRWI